MPGEQTSYEKYDDVIMKDDDRARRAARREVTWFSLPSLKKLFSLGTQDKFILSNYAKIDMLFASKIVELTGCAKLIFTLCKIAVILAVSTLQKRVIRLWNGNFVGFLGIFSKIMKNVPMKSFSHFSGKWQNRPTRI